MIVVVNYGMGNLNSIANMVKKIGYAAMISSRPEDIEKAEKLILPGVGPFDTGIAILRESGLAKVLYEKVIRKKAPLLGICLGMQLLTLRSEEGRSSGLGWIDAETIKFRFPKSEKSPRVPHMGWNTIRVMKETPLFPPDQDEKRFYFVHSYHVICHDENDILTTTIHGVDFVSSVQKGNIIGVQFHPEKSHRFGIDFFNRFVELQSPC